MTSHSSGTSLMMVAVMFASFACSVRCYETMIGPDGLQIEILHSVDPEECTIKSQNGDILRVHYTGKFKDGKEFDSSIPSGEPYKFKLGAGQAIRGYDLGLIDMCVGERRRLTIPSDLAYGDDGKPDVIPGGATLIFDDELMSIERPKKKLPPCIEGPSGLKIEILRFVEPDQCKMMSRDGDILRIHYTGKLEDGTVFDSSVPNGDPFKFKLGKGQAIRGYDLGLLDMCVDEKRLLVIPSELAYGERGIPNLIPGGATLILEGELVSIKRPKEKLEEL